MDSNTVRSSKFLSLILRHRPESVGISLDDNGWTDVTDLLKAMAKMNHKITISQLEAIVQNCPKQRFAFNSDKSMIRANQGHSVEVELQLKSVEPPEILYHGTTGRFLDSIRASGLLKMNRHHVHLSIDENTAKIVGGRRGKAVVLTVRSGEMFRKSHEFFKSNNGVWLTDCVPPEFIDFPPI